MRVITYLSDNESENLVLTAFHEGCQEDKKLSYLDDYEPSDVAVVFGTYKQHVPVSFRRGRIVMEQLRNKRDVVILETGYINRGAGETNHYAAGLNGLNGRAIFRNENSPDDRAKKLGVELKPWRERGGHILLCGQVPWDASVDHIDFIDWVNWTVREIKNLTDRQIRFRPHPLASLPTPAGCARSVNKDLIDDLQNCWAVVTCNSNSGVEAVIEGIPVFAADEGSMAWDVANKDIALIEAPEMPDRRQWLNNLCYAQWTPEEMRNGEAWWRLFPST